MSEENKKTELREVEGENLKLKFAVFFVVAVLVGIVVKNQAMKTIVIGFDDYKVADLKSDFDLKKVDEISEKNQSEDENANGDVNNNKEEPSAESTPAPSCN